MCLEGGPAELVLWDPHGGLGGPYNALHTALAAKAFFTTGMALSSSPDPSATE